jgi:anthranilate synthase component 1
MLAWRTLPADLLTPVAAYLRLAQGRRNCFLLESIEGGVARGRYSVIGLDPDLIWRCRDGKAEVGRSDGNGLVFTAEDVAPIESLRRLVSANRATLPAGIPPMVSGLFGYLGYDMVREMERLPLHGHDDLGMPDAMLLRPSLFAVFDNVRDELFLAAPIRDRPEEAEARLDWAAARLAESLPPGDPTVPPVPSFGEPVSNCTRAQFLGIVEECRALIEAGDVFQVVPSQRFSRPFGLDPLSLYRALRRINPAPFLYVLELDDGCGPFGVVGSSPEILVRLRDNRVTVRPLAGTRRRGVDQDEDRALAAELLADPKERAEHLMLVDLGRNDVGRVCALGTVRVVETFAIERFSHVMHISSTVEGEAIDALVAGFPAGTLSGAPKIRAMEIIETVEPTRRGVYGGCIGYFAVDGTMDTCIGLRTAVLKDGMMHVQAGCGVVADSVALSEWEETRQKASALFRAADEAQRFAHSAGGA